MEDTGVTPGLGRLRGKSAVVTGAAKGIGRATAELFAREGALLVLTDVDEAGLEELGERLAGRDAEVETVVGDVSVPKDAKRMIEAAVERFGRIDILVANAGVIPLNTIVDATPEDWDYVMSVDGRGMFLTCKYAIEEMLKTGGGSIVCLSSISDQAPRGRVGREGHPSKRGGAGYHLDRGGRGATGRVQGADAGGSPARAPRRALRGGACNPVPRHR
jgi:NAD(P)-dependent dehydrogenase (short-subunit alcohol dehydrogenase family)